jgi:type II secretory ATPase GspE/PulE/Tfp pilus assembly ATPase PilB-like protein
MNNLFSNRKDKTRKGNDWVSLNQFLIKNNINISIEEDISTILKDYTVSNKQSFSNEIIVVFKKFSIVPLVHKKTNQKVLLLDKVFKRVPSELLSEIANSIIISTPQVISKILKENFLESKIYDISNPHEFINDMLSKATFIGSSDIYISSQKNDTSVKYRIDNHLDPEYFDSIDHSFANSIRLSLIHMSNEDEFSTKPIDGKFSIYINGELKEFRLSIASTQQGFAIVIRAYQMDNGNSSLVELGYSPKAIDMISEIMQKRYGMFLVTGATGSGKTTGIYSMLNTKKDDENIIIKTIEDPVEIIQDGIDQFQVNVKGDKEHHFTYNDAIKTFLRQKPDIMVVGEVRDKQVAEQLIRASFTGHFVMSTLHTGSVDSTIGRLFDLDVTKDQLEDSLCGILNQRLIPKLCSCKIKNEDGSFSASSCISCQDNFNPGYDGVVVVCEIANIDFAPENFKSENFIEYYSLNDNLDYLLTQGIIDEKTKKLTLL